jgi:hypothetical protein
MRPFPHPPRGGLREAALAGTAAATVAPLPRRPVPGTGPSS